MNSGTIAIHGDAGNVVGLSMRTGKIFVKGSVGYRVGIHMKAYKDQCPVIVVGGKAGDFLGEYMAGGKLIVLGIFKKEKDPVAGRYIATGMHGGTIYIRGGVNKNQLGRDVAVEEVGDEEKTIIKSDIEAFCRYFGVTEIDDILSSSFIKLSPRSSRPYGRLYAY
jgi:glutamate synthase domain-containing protein 3